MDRTPDDMGLADHRYINMSYLKTFLQRNISLHLLVSKL